MKKHF